MQIEKKTIKMLFISALGCILVYWLLHETERFQMFWSALLGIASPFILGAIFAFVLNVPVRGIERGLKFIHKPGLRRLMAIILTFVCVILILAGVVWLLVPQLNETIQALIPKLQVFFEGVEVRIREFLADNPQLLAWINTNTDLEKLDWASLIQKAAAMFRNSISAIAGGAFNAVGTITGGIVDTVIGLVFSLYCLSRKEILARQGRRLLYSIFPEHFSDEVIRILRLTNSTFSNFISGQCLEAVILGCLFAVSMAIFRMPYIPLVSMLIAVTALVPIVGAFVGCVLGAFFILVNDPLQAVWFVVMFLILQQIENNMIYPRVVGTSIGLPGMWVLVAVAIGGDLMGVAGMLIMIPVTSVVYTLLREFTQKRVRKLGIAPEKLQDQPPELKSKFKENRERKKEQRLLKKMKSLAEKHGGKEKHKS